MAKDDGLDAVKVYYERSPIPPELSSLQTTFEQAAAAGLKPALLTYPGDDLSLRTVAKRRHDLVAAMRTLGFTVKALQSGYTFQDDKAAAKIEAIHKAVQILERESDKLARFLLGLGHK